MFSLFFSTILYKNFVLFYSLYILKFSVSYSVNYQKILLLNLIIGTVTIHPIAFYYFMVTFLMFFFFSQQHTIVLRIGYSLKYLTLFLFITLFLGSIWALQSNSWGYFWVNDAVEWLLLTVILYLTWYLHNWRYNFSSLNYLLYPLFLINLLLLIRLNFLPTRHNFINTKLVIFIIFGIYLVIAELTQKKFKNVFRFTTKFFLKFFTLLIIVFLKSYTLFLLKYVFMLFLIFFFSYKLNPLVSNFYFHLLLLVGIFTWLILFSFFFIFYTEQLSISFLSALVFDYSLLFNYQIFNFSDLATPLESIVFQNQTHSIFTITTKYMTQLLIILNNFSLICILLFITFLKMVEFRFLYKEETYF